MGFGEGVSACVASRGGLCDTVGGGEVRSALYFVATLFEMNAMGSDSDCDCVLYALRCFYLLSRLIFSLLFALFAVCAKYYLFHFISALFCFAFCFSLR